MVKNFDEEYWKEKKTQGGEKAFQWHQGMSLKRNISTRNLQEESVGTHKIVFKMAEKFPMWKEKKKRKNIFL